MHNRRRVEKVLLRVLLVAATAGVACVNDPTVGEAPDATPDRALLLGASNFDSLIVRPAGVAVVEFYQKGCGTCQGMAWIIDSLAARYADSAVVGAVDIVLDAPLGNRYSITAVPTYLFFKDGEPVARRSAGQLDSAAVDTLAALLQAVISGSMTVDTPQNRVLMLTAADFDSAITGEYSLAVIDFFMPGDHCSDCIAFDTVIDTLARTLPGGILIGKVNGMDEASLADKFAIQTFPTVLYFKNGVEIHQTYGLDSAGFFRGVIDSLLQLPYSRVLQLTSANFDRVIKGNYGLAMIDFFSPYCYHCTALAPVIDSLALLLPDSILIGKVDVTRQTFLSDTFTIKAYPTLVYFKNGLEMHRTLGQDSVGFFQGIIDSLLPLPVDTVPSRILTLTAASFDPAITGDYSLAMIDFFSPNSPECIALAPVINSLARMLPDSIFIGNVNIDKETSLSDTFTIETYPTVVYFKNGLEIHRTVGLDTAGFFQGVVDSLLHSP